MKKKVFRERYSQYVKNVEIFKEKIENPGEVTVIEEEEEPKKRGRKKSVKSDK